MGDIEDVLRQSFAEFPVPINQAVLVKIRPSPLARGQFTCQGGNQWL